MKSNVKKNDTDNEWTRPSDLISTVTEIIDFSLARKFISWNKDANLFSLTVE